MIWLRVKVCFLLVSLLFSSAALSQEISGYAEAKGFFYGERSNSRDSSVVGWGTLFTKWEEKVAEAQLTASVRGEWISTDEQDSLTFDPADRNIRRSPISVQDLWVRLPLTPSLDLQVGRFQLGWGKTDGYSPADAFLPRDLSDPFADEKIPLWALRLNGERGAFRYEAVVAPVTTPWRLPLLSSRNVAFEAGGVPEGIMFEELDSSPPAEGFAALRLLATYGQWDVGAWGRAGVRPAPLLDFRFDQAMATPSGFTVPIGRHYAREQGVGVEVSKIIGSWVVRGEAAGLLSRDRDLGDAIIGALSAERGIGDGTLLFTLAGNAIDPPIDESLLFDRGILPAVITAWNRSEDWGGWKVVWTSGLKYGDGLLKGEIGYNLTDIWKATVGGELPYGTEAGPLGALHAARRVHVALRRSW